MKCPACESVCEPEHEAEPETNTGVGRYHCSSCSWSEPDGDAAPRWCLARIEDLEAQLARSKPVVVAAVQWRDPMTCPCCHRLVTQRELVAGRFRCAACKVRERAVRG